MNLSRDPRYDGIVQMYESGMTTTQIAERFGVTRAVAWRLLVRRGCKFRPRGNPIFYIGKQRPDRRANGIVTYFIACGRLVKQPCEVCGERKVRAHHDDYNKPVEIRWLCAKHHFEWHQKNKAISV